MARLTSFTGGFTATNGYLLIQASGDAVLVDAPEGIASWPELDDLRVRALLLTHAHFDHVIDAAAVAERFACPIHAFSPYRPDLTLEDQLSSFGMDLEVAPYEVDHLLEGKATVSAADCRFRILHVPGHSPDSLCFLLDETDSHGNRVLLGGDVLFQRGIGRTDFAHSDHELLLRGIREKLYPLPDETLVFPGHGPWTTIGDEKRENPFVTA